MKATLLAALDPVVPDPHGQSVEEIRSYLPPLVRSLAAPIGKIIPSRSGAREQLQESTAQKSAPTEWTPWGVKQVVDRGVRLSSGPQAGMETRHAVGQGYSQDPNLWKLSGVADGWSRPFAPTPGRQPTTAFAIGRWTPFGGSARPLPGNPAPAQMLRPAL